MVFSTLRASPYASLCTSILESRKGRGEDPKISFAQIDNCTGLPKSRLHRNLISQIPFTHELYCTDLEPVKARPELVQRQIQLCSERVMTVYLNIGWDKVNDRLQPNY